MAYSKTTWQNNVTDIDENNLNKIEQGIYDNSLVVDAVTNTLNPTDTETYKTAELTEGQITDVIGVNDIVIKGQTEQDGTPTSSAPVDVNVVSGNNVVNTSSKNLLNISNLITQTLRGVTITKNKDMSITLNGTSTSAITLDIPINDIVVKENTNYTFSKSTNMAGGAYSISLRDTNKDYVGSGSIDSGGKFVNINVNTNQIAKYFRLYIVNGKTFTNHTFYPMLEQGSTSTTYEPHQGKELPLDLPVENLFDGELELGTFDASGNPASGTTSVRTKNYIQVKPNTIYTISNNFNYQNVIQTYNSSKTFINALGNVSIFTTDSNTYYIKWRSSMNANENNLNVKYQIEPGSKANAYTPYGTDPIELCKIGDYQDYFYKSGSKWYLHKEIEKKVLNGSENWQLANSGTSNYYYYYNLGHTTIQSSSIASTHYPYAFISNSNTEQGILVLADGNIRIRYGTENTVANFKTWLATNNVSVYYPLATATNTEITDTTLISQLEAIYNAPLYEQTNITQENNDLPMVLDIIACKDNINGIKAFIRK